MIVWKKIKKMDPLLLFQFSPIVGKKGLNEVDPNGKIHFLKIIPIFDDVAINGSCF